MAKRPSSSRPQPPFRRIAAELRDAILQGRLAPGERMPSEYELAKRYQATRSTVRKAIALLTSEGLVITEQGRGTFVRPRPPLRLVSTGANYLARRASGISNFNAEAAAQDRQAEQRILEVTVIEGAAVPTDIAALLGIREGERVLVRRRLFLVDGEPDQLVDSYYPYELVRGSGIEQPAKIRGGAHTELERHLERRVARFVEDLFVRMPVPREAQELRLAPGVPVVRSLRTTFDESGAVVEVLDSIIPADRHVFRFEIDVL